MDFQVIAEKFRQLRADGRFDSDEILQLLEFVCRECGSLAEQVEQLEQELSQFRR